MVILNGSYSKIVYIEIYSNKQYCKWKQVSSGVAGDVIYSVFTMPHCGHCKNRIDKIERKYDRRKEMPKILEKRKSEEWIYKR